MDSNTSLLSFIYVEPMDPLSVTVSVLALVGAVSAAVKHAQTLLDAPKEIIALSNDIVDVDIVIQEIVISLSGKAGTRWTESSRINVSKLLKRAEQKLRRLSFIFHEKLVTSPADVGKKKYAKLAWLKHKSEVEDLRHGLSDVKLSLIAVMGAATSINISEVLLRLEEIHVQPKTRPKQPELVTWQSSTRRDEDDEELREPSAITTEPRDGTVPVASRTVLAGSSSRKRASHLHPAEDIMLKSVIADPTNMITLRASRSGCPRWCSCSCHKPARLQSPKLLDQVLGALTIGYSGTPFLSSPCSEKLCRPRNSSTTQIMYQFPAWFMARTIMMSLTSFTTGPELSLKTLRVLPSTADVFRFAQSGDLDGIKTLFSKGQASIYDVDACHWSILHKAFLVGHKEVCQFLIKAGADPHIAAQNASNVVERAWHFDRTNTGSEGNLATVYDEIFKRVDMEEFVENQQYTPVHKIVLGLSHLDLAHHLETSTATIDQVDTRSRTTLWWAAARGDENAVRTLLEYQASLHGGSRTGHGVLHVAQTPGVVKLLLKHGGDINGRDEKGRTPLHACAYRGQGRGGNADLLRSLLEGGADVHARTNAGHTPLHYAAAYGFVEHLQILLRWGADLESRRYDGFTALMLAVLSNEVQAMEYMLQNGSDYLAVDTQDRTILHLAAMNGDYRTLNALNKAKLDGVNSARQDAQGRTARQYYENRRIRLTALDTVFTALINAFTPPPSTTGDVEDDNMEDEDELYEDAKENVQ